MLVLTVYANEKDSLSFQYPLELELDCDACGCSITGGGSSLENLLYSNYIGVKYIHQYYRAQENIFAKDLNEKQQFNTVQLWGRIPLTKRLDIYGSLPYHTHEKKGKNTTSITGIGDMNIMGIYKLIEPQTSTNTIIKHQLSAGVGIKIPLAKFDEKNVGTANPSFQLGTGSWDTQLAMNYQLMFGAFALQLGSDYVFKGKNSKSYQFGNQWNQNMQIQVFLMKTETVIVTKLGIQNEMYSFNKEYKEKVPKTKGDVQLLKFGLEGAYRQFSFGAEYFQPLASNLNAGEVVLKHRMGLFLNYVL